MRNIHYVCERISKQIKGEEEGIRGEWKGERLKGYVGTALQGNSFHFRVSDVTELVAVTVGCQSMWM